MLTIQNIISAMNKYKVKELLLKMSYIFFSDHIITNILIATFLYFPNKIY